MSDVKVFKSQTFVTEPVRAVFPHLNEVDKYGSFSIDIDAIANSEERARIEANAAATLAAAHADIGTDRQPTNKIVRVGEYKDEAFERIGFKMKATKKVKGKDVSQSPTLIDAAKNPVTELIYGGSLVKIAYFIQYTLMPTGTFLSVKLRGVQVLELVGPGGEVPCTDAFGVEDGFVQESETPPAPVETVEETPVSAGSDF